MRVHHVAFAAICIVAVLVLARCGGEIGPDATKGGDAGDPSICILVDCTAFRSPVDHCGECAATSTSRGCMCCCN